jgi:hypothetical protein
MFTPWFYFSISVKNRNFFEFFVPIPPQIEPTKLGGSISLFLQPAHNSAATQVQRALTQTLLCVNIQPSICPMPKSLPL